MSCGTNILPVFLYFFLLVQSTTAETLPPDFSSLIGLSESSSIVLSDISPAASSIVTSDNASSLDPVTEFIPGDFIRYTIQFPVRLFAVVFAAGTVTFSGAENEKLPLQFKLFIAGQHSFYWDSIVPAGASGEATVVITYLGIPGRITRETSTFKISQSPQPVQEYVGSPRCMSCHAGFNPDVVNAYTQSGHFFALSPVSGKVPAYPAFAPGVPDTPAGSSWNDIAYVIGGYGWAANFASRDNGTLVTGPGAQYNPANSLLKTPAEFVAYEPATATPGQFTCGACHATGYSSEGSQDNRTGIAGTWFEDGVGCEACHGPGSLHAYDPYGAKPSFDPQAACANCHVRDSRSVVEAGAGLILNKQQAEELNTTAKSFMQCATCHNAHASAHYDDLASGSAIIKQCTACHSSVTVGLGMQNLACIDCHMPYAVKAGASNSFTDSANNGYALGDMRSHIFKINADAAAPADMLSDNGTRLALDTSGKTAGLTLDFVCLGCHRTGGRAATSYTFEQVKGLAKSVH
jgi:hypothetical protein